MENDLDNWKSKFQKIVSSCQDELKKTTEIGKKMLVASKKSGDLREKYEELGQCLFAQIESGSLDVESEKVVLLVQEIRDCKVELNKIENEVSEIKVDKDEA